MASAENSLTRVRHQIGAVSVVDAFWIGLTVVSLWFCRAAGVPADNVNLLWFSVLHVVAVPWGIVLLCLPTWYCGTVIVAFGVALALLDIIALVFRLGDIVDCFSSCPFCEFWLLFLAGGFVVLSLAWLAFAFRYASQDAQHNAQKRDNDDMVGEDGSSTLDENRSAAAVGDGMRKRPVF